MNLSQAVANSAAYYFGMLITVMEILCAPKYSDNMPDIMLKTKFTNYDYNNCNSYYLEWFCTNTEKWRMSCSSTEKQN
jgi:hypothetical protein